jgi:hypothetical protein
LVSHHREEKPSVPNVKGKLTGNKALEEGLVGEVGVVLLKLGLGRRNQLHGNELEAVHS